MLRIHTVIEHTMGSAWQVSFIREPVKAKVFVIANIVSNASTGPTDWPPV